MKIYPALAALEFDDIPSGVFATDAMLKKAPIAFFKSGTITQGRYLTVIGGTTASVEESAREGQSAGIEHLIDSVLLPDIHPRLYESVLGHYRPGVSRSVAILETNTISASLRAAEAALKGTPVELVEIRLADNGLAGKAVVVLDGHLPDVEEAIRLATTAAESGACAKCSSRLIAAPNDSLATHLGRGTWFGSSLVIDLDGESV